MTAVLDHARYCDEIETQSDRLAALLHGSDGHVPVPTCPAWTLADLVDHVTVNLRALDAAVGNAEVRAARLRAGGSAVDSGAISSTDHPSPGGSAGDSHSTGSAAAGTPGLTRAGADAAAALRRAGPQLRVRMCGLDGTARSWARRTAHDLLVHRADVALALGRPFDASPDAGADALDEILELFAGPPVPAAPRRPQIVLRATDTGTAWSISPDDGSFTWRRAPASVGATAGTTTVTTAGTTAVTTTGTTAVTELAGPTTQLLLVTYRRLPPRGASAGGSAQLLEWLDSLAFT